MDTRGAAILDVRRIDTYYGLAHVPHGLSLYVDEGEVVALLGRNGAGKTTTMRAITSLTPPRTGEVLYRGQNIAGRPAHQISRLGIALVPETRGVFSYLSARENLEVPLCLSSQRITATGGRSFCSEAQRNTSMLTSR